MVPASMRDRHARAGVFLPFLIFVRTGSRTCCIRLHRGPRLYPTPYAPHPYSTRTVDDAVRRHRSAEVADQHQIGIGLVDLPPHDPPAIGADRETGDVG